MPTSPTPGRSLVTRRAIVDLVRNATLGSYGVTGFAAGWLERALGRAGIGQPGVRVDLADPLSIDLDVTVAHGVPVAEVARQLDSAIRYAVRHAIGVEIGRLAIHIDGLRVRPAATPPIRPPGDGPTIRSEDLAGSGTDVA